MKNNYLSITVTNNDPVPMDAFFMKDPTRLPPKGSITVEYDPLSTVNSQDKTTAMKLVESGRVTLTAHITVGDRVVTIPYGPTATFNVALPEPSFHKEQAPVIAEQAPAADTAEEAVAESKDDFQARYEELTADHNWNGALNLLIERFGAEKITFTARALVGKDYNTVITRYKLI